MLNMAPRDPVNATHMLPRRTLLAGVAALGAQAVLRPARAAAEPAPTPAPAAGKALIAVSLDLEMARNFPKWEDAHWDYEKGNLNDETKAYAVEAARRVKAAGGVVHFFLVGRALEQENVDWLKEIVAAGHPVGNHTYDHVYVRATKPEEIQYRFKRAPWLIDGKETKDVIRENIRLCTAALKTRIGVEPAGFRTPGGFSDGLKNAPDVQQMLLDLGFTWVSSLYPAHPNCEPGTEPSDAVFDGILKAQPAAQPFAYPSGLVEVPMNPISDINAFRTGRWKLDAFLKATRMSVEWAIENRAVFDFLSHPSVLYSMDPEFRVIDLLCELAGKAGERAALVDLNAVAQRVAKK